jgi:L-aminopeptidase/D-esterase-like protein
VAANPIGSATVGDTGFFWAAPFEQSQEFGGRGLPSSIAAGDLRLRMKPPAWGTTIGVVATDATFTAAQAHRLAIAAQDGVARAVLPAHLAGDGDTIFAAATGLRAPVASLEQLAELCLAATLVTARAIARAIFAARSNGRPGEQPCWHTRFGQPTGDAP